MKIVFFILFLMTSFQSFKVLADAPLAKIVQIKGEVSFQGRPLDLSHIVSGRGILKTGPKSFVKLAVAKWNNFITVGADSEMDLNLMEEVQDKRFYSLTKGLCRWKSNLVKGMKSKGGVHTPLAALGVRGTDFILIVNPLFEETELVVFEGQVEFTSKLDGSDVALVGAGQWGGLGGRFGKKIGELIDLPKNVLEHFSHEL